MISNCRITSVCPYWLFNKSGDTEIQYGSC